MSPLLLVLPLMTLVPTSSGVEVMAVSANRLAVIGPPARGSIPSFVGPDKPVHAAMSFALVMFGQAAAAGIGSDAGDARVIGVAISVAGGIAKELHDLSRGGLIDVADLTWNLAGIAIGWLLVGEIR
jgi:uncharacterized protein YfiM (DUF2279 family)